ncbi:MAG: hypothetical protein K0S98_1042 [Propionibacteriaceae bacterium]|nr:hypothetical protein [Propionibacteriaceae bacterium]
MVAVALWRCRLQQNRTRCLYVAESSLAAAERLQHIKRHCQQKDARIYAERGWNAVRAVESIDAMTEPAPRRAQTEVPPRRALPQALPRRGWVVA